MSVRFRLLQVDKHTLARGCRLGEQAWAMSVQAVLERERLARKRRAEVREYTALLLPTVLRLLNQADNGSRAQEEAVRAVHERLREGVRDWT